MIGRRVCLNNDSVMDWISIENLFEPTLKLDGTYRDGIEAMYLVFIPGPEHHAEKTNVWPACRECVAREREKPSAIRWIETLERLEAKRAAAPTQLELAV